MKSPLSAILVIICIACISSKSVAQELTLFPSFFGYCYYQDDVELSKKEFKSLIYSDELSKTYWKKANRQQIYGGISIVAEIGLLYGSISASDEGTRNGLLTGAVAAAIASIVFTVQSNNNRKNAILAYNKGLDGYSLKFDGTTNGMGLVMKF